MGGGESITMMSASAARSFVALSAALVVGAAFPARATDTPTAPNAQPQAPRSLSLEQAVRLALQSQPQLAIAESQLSSSRNRLVETNSSYYPQITPSIQHTSRRSSYRTGGETLVQRSDGTETSVGLRQLVFDMGKREANVAAAKSSVRAAELSLINSRQMVVLNVTNAYYELLRRRELLRVQEAAVERAKTTFEATRAFVEAGTVRQIDILQAEADYRNAQVQLGITGNNVRLAEVALRNAIGIDPDQSVTAEEGSPPWPDTKADTDGVSGRIAKAIENRPDLKRDLAYLDADRAAARLARINAGLQVEADVTAGYRFDPDPGDNQVLMATLSFPLFDGGASRARARSAAENIKQTLEQLALARQEIHLAVEEAYLSREEARQRIPASRAASEAARANYEAASASYREGTQTVVDVITARTQLVTAETNLVQALYDYHTADARLKRAIGENDPY